jgi:hypothetical protein
MIFEISVLRGFREDFLATLPSFPTTSGRGLFLDRAFHLGDDGGALGGK